MTFTQEDLEKGWFYYRLGKKTSTLHKCFYDVARAKHDIEEAKLDLKQAETNLDEWQKMLAAGEVTDVASYGRM